MKSALLAVLVLIIANVSENQAQRRGDSDTCPRVPHLVEDGRRCRRLCDDNSDCRGINKRCLCDGPCGMSCFNPLSHCPVLANPSNGTFTYTAEAEFAERIWGSTATYQCNEGYALRGVDLRTCHSDRMWSGQSPTCSDLGICGQTLNAAGVRQQSAIFQKVVGGVDAEEGAWPWQVGIFLDSSNVLNTFRSGLRGAGSLINKYWILSAAHVIEALEKGTNSLDSSLLALGYNELPSNLRPGSTTGKLFRPKFAIKHPQYAPGLFDYDYAMIRIGREVTIDGTTFKDEEDVNSGVVFTEFIRPICLPCTGTCVTPDDILNSRGERLLTGDETPEERCAIESDWLRGKGFRNLPGVVITGFGSIAQRTHGRLALPVFPRKLLQGVLTLRNDEQCQEAIRRANNFQRERIGNSAVLLSYTDQMLCALGNVTNLRSGDEVNIDACQGDSGGPLVRQIITGTGNNTRECWVQLGVVSFGFGCAWRQDDYSYPGFYADVSKVLFWINSCQMRLTDAAKSDDLVCEVAVNCLVREIADGIDAGTTTYPVLLEGFQVSAYTLVTFSCINNSLTIDGPSVVTCLPNGTWSGPYPTRCVRRCNLEGLSDDVNVLQNGQAISTVRALFATGEQISFRCRDPTAILNGMSGPITCTSAGEFDSAFPTGCTLRSSFCYAFGGGPHYTTFDGTNFEFQGTCSYQLLRNTNQNEPNIPLFIVEVENEQRGGNTRVAWLNKVYVRIDDRTTIELLRGRSVKIDGFPVNLPVHRPENRFNIRLSGRFVLIQTTFGLEVSFDGEHYVAVGLDMAYREKVEGLCGNFDGNENNDLQSLSRSVPTNAASFGNQFQTATKANCERYVPHVDPPCADEQQFGRDCSILTDESACFSNCTAFIDPKSFFDNCVVDACRSGASKLAVDNNVGAYVKTCQDQGIQICSDWRVAADVPLECPANSFYITCSSRCPRNCASIVPEETCDPACIEGCECNEGFVLSGEECVPEESCGCEYRGQYYKPQERFYDDRDCESLCQCTNGQVECRKASCREGLVCGRDIRGSTACVAVGEATCMIWGNVHYKPFDGNNVYDYDGACTYLLAETVNVRPTSSRWFMINSTNVKVNNIASLQSITLTLRREIVVELRNGTITYNGEEIQGLDQGPLTIQPSGRYIRLTTRQGLEILFGGNEVQITVASNYARMVNGICGNYNGDASDDLRIRDGEPTNNFNFFALSYKAADTCAAQFSRQPFECSNDVQRRLWRGFGHCGAIRRSQEGGPFIDCHPQVDPRVYFNKCVLDACAARSNDTAGEALQTYASLCLEKSVAVCEWRTLLGRQIQCPPNSRYQGCASPCPDTCQFPSASGSCTVAGFVEGCVCNVGYLRDGVNGCVRRNECGTTEEGVYTTGGEVDPVGPIVIRSSRADDTFRGMRALLESAPPIQLTIPNFHFYLFDGGIHSIMDGGSDMYDDGNFIKVYKNGVQDLEVVYNRTYRRDEYSFSSFAVHPFAAMLYLRNENDEQLNITLAVHGDAGADDDGRVILYNGTLSHQNYHCIYYVVQVANAGSDPSICEVYAMLYSEEEWQSVLPDDFSMARVSTFSSRLNNSAQMLGRMKNVMLGYTLLSRRAGQEVTEAQVQAVLNFVLNAIAINDVNECRRPSDNNCEDVCENVLGSYQCFCSDELFVLAPDRRSCVENQANRLLQRSLLIEPELPNIIPSWHRYSFDGIIDNNQQIHFIRDGTFDLYDSGNRIFIYEGSRQPDESISYGTVEGRDGYDIAVSIPGAYPFLAYVWIKNDRAERKTYSILVSSDYGADGGGSVQLNRGTVRLQDGQIDYRANQIYNAGDASVSEIFFVASRRAWGSSTQYRLTERFDNSTSFGENRVQVVGTPRNVLFSYALLSKINGIRVTDFDVRTFLGRIGQYMITGSRTPPFRPVIPQ